MYSGNHLFVEIFCNWIKAGWGFRFETMTQIATRHESCGNTEFSNGAPDRTTKLQVVFVVHKTIAERYYPPAPSVPLEKIKRNCRAVIEFVALVQRRYRITIFISSSYDRV